jgi:uncharacterized membrane protein YeaQ/YmgE (transglycosylase-associated protein family)
MTWTVTNLLIQIITGILGGHAAASAAKEHGFGAFGHTIVGALGGALSGYFLQTFASTVVTGSGSISEPTALEEGVLQGLTGAAAGGIAMLLFGFVKHSMQQKNRS